FEYIESTRCDYSNRLVQSYTVIQTNMIECFMKVEGFVGRVDGDIDEFTKLAHRLQDEITAARMVPIGTLYSRLTRAVRDAAKSAGKQVEVDLSGGDTELDNSIIQQIGDQLVDLVRSAVTHVIEIVPKREAAGKHPVGRVSHRVM